MATKRVGTPHQRLVAALKSQLNGSSTAALRAQRKNSKRVLGREVVEAISEASREQFEREAELDRQNPDRHLRPATQKEVKFK
jgi:uncharacterized protein YaiL (DUF2058 family)